jgi:hypothetical protein
MGDSNIFGDISNFEFYRFDAEILEQANALTKQNWYEVDADFVQQPGFEALLRNICATDANTFVAREFFCFCNGAFDAIGDEGERRIWLVDPFLLGMMGQDNNWDVQGVLATPRPGDIKHSAPR